MYAQELTVYPVAHGQFINFAAFRASYDREYSTFDGPWVEDVAPDELLADFDQWEPEVRALFQVGRSARDSTPHRPTD